jgi:conjugal transfer/entry exclusion protein
MQFTKEQVDTQIAKLQTEIPQLQNQLQQLIGYRQALVEMEETEEPDTQQPE